MIVGIDLAMEKFDANWIDEKGKEQKKVFKNTVNGIEKFLMKIPEGSTIVAEHTGTYGKMLLYICNAMDAPFALVSGYEIKHSLGLQKGKSDPVDAARIREYGERFTDRLTLAEFESEDMLELKTLYTTRSQLVQARKRLKTGDQSVKFQPMQSIAANDCLQKVIASLDEQIQECDKTILELIKKNDDYIENYELITSITGVGPVIATDLIIKTENFVKLDTARKCSSYAGVCPFVNSSGKMVIKSKVSQFADKKLKTLLYMGAKTALVHNKEYKLYYQKKSLEGKPYFLIMNNISNKLLRTVYSVVQKKEPYDWDYICLDPREKIAITG